jgi:hypothetical protein
MQRQQPDGGARRLMEITAAFNKGEQALAELIGSEKAKELFDEQREVASKVHRVPPENVRGTRF